MIYTSIHLYLYPLGRFCLHLRPSLETDLYRYGCRLHHCLGLGLAHTHTHTCTLPHTHIRTRPVAECCGSRRGETIVSVCVFVCAARSPRRAPPRAVPRRRRRPRARAAGQTGQNGRRYDSGTFRSASEGVDRLFAIRRNSARRGEARNSYNIMYGYEEPHRS